MATILVVSMFIYAAGMIVIGFWGYKKTGQGLTELFLAGRQLTPLLLLFSLVFTQLSAFTFMGMVSAYYVHGPAFFILVTQSAFVGLLMFLLGSKFWHMSREYGYMNLTDYFSARFESPLMAPIISIVMFLFSACYIAVQVMGAGLAFQGLSLGVINYNIGCFYLVILILIYTVSGGLRAVALSDLVQGIIMTVALYIAAVFIVGKGTGSISNLIDFIVASSPKHLEIPGPKGVAGYPFLIGLWITFAFANFSYPWMIQRYMSAVSLKSLRISAILFPIGVIVLFLPQYYIALTGVMTESAIKNPDLLLPVMMSKYLHPAFQVIILFGILAAMMSTASSVVLNIGSLMTKDVFGKFIKDDAQATQLGRIMTIVFLSVTMACLYVVPGNLVTITTNMVTPGLAQMFPALIAALFWKRANKYGVVSGVLAGVVVVAFAALAQKPTLWGWNPGIIGLLFNMALLIVVSYITPVPSGSVNELFGKQSKAQATIK
ncbi:MAG: sodium:solute symporter family protein [Firmicutes bacterium]|nr:sodium:solute symporter family protein [Bacillota bacterium]